MSPTNPMADEHVASQLERVIRRVKHSMHYRGSYSTRDILGSLVARWLQSGEWERIKQLPEDQRHLGESVRRFILDRFDQLRRRGKREEVIDLELPDEQMLAELVEAAELRAWIADRVGELERGVVDARVRIPIAHPDEIGAMLRRYLDGKTQREIARELDVSVGLVNKRIAEGTNYLVVLQGIECGLV